MRNSARQHHSRVNHRRRPVRGRLWFAAALAFTAPAFGATYTLPFHANFEPGSSLQEEWQTCNTIGAPDCPPDPVLVACPQGGAPYSRCWGPLKMETWPDATQGAPVYAGVRSAIQNVFDPYWVSIFHEFDPPTGVGDLRAVAWQYDPASIICTCECNCDPDGPLYGYPDGRPNYQAQGWLTLSNAMRTEAYALGVNSYSSWVHLSWYTRTDGWNQTSIPRVNGWRKLEILVHPYQARAGDVEFRVDDATVALGQRAAGASGPIAVDRLRLGGDPALIAQNILTNTFQEFRYDEVHLSFEPQECPAPRADFDGDADVDLNDVGIWQRCFTGASGASFDAAACHCMDFNDDELVDAEDFEVFAACASRSQVAADIGC